MAIGAILSQNHKPICYASRTLNEHEINYSMTEKNYYPSYGRRNTLDHASFGRAYEILNDHKPLVFLNNIK